MSAGVGKGDRHGINPWLIAWIVSIATFMEVLDVSIANVALRHIAGSIGGFLRSSDLDTDQLSGRECRDPSGQRLALVGPWPQAILYVLRRSLHSEFAAMWIGRDSRILDFLPRAAGPWRRWPCAE